MYKDYPAAYQVSKGSALQVDKAFYEQIRDKKDGRTLIEAFEVPIRTGRAWKVPAGPCVPSDHARRPASRGFQRLECQRSTGAFVGGTDPAVTGRSRQHP